MFSTSWKSVTMGIDPPERMKTVSFLNTSCMASVAALMNRLSVPTTQAGPLLCTVILVGHEAHGHFRGGLGGNHCFCAGSGKAAGHPVHLESGTRPGAVEHGKSRLARQYL